MTSGTAILICLIGMPTALVAGWVAGWLAARILYAEAQP